MTLFLLFFACSTPPQNDFVPPTEPLSTASPGMDVDMTDAIAHEPLGEDLCVTYDRITWKGDVWLVGGETPRLADVDKNEVCAFGYPIVHPRHLEFSFCEKRSGRGKCITVHPELETLDE